MGQTNEVRNGSSALFAYDILYSSGFHGRYDSEYRARETRWKNPFGAGRQTGLCALSGTVARYIPL